MTERIPAFGEAGIKTVNNGPICYTPDGCPLLAPLRRYPGLWVAAGIGTGSGSGQFLADWMVGRALPYDLPIVDPARFAGDTDRATCLKGIRQTYAEGYALPVSAVEPLTPAKPTRKAGLYRAPDPAPAMARLHVAATASGGPLQQIPCRLLLCFKVNLGLVSVRR